MAPTSFLGIQLQTPPEYKGTHTKTGIFSALDGEAQLGWLASRWCAKGSCEWHWHLHGYDLQTGQELYQLKAHEYLQWIHWHAPTQRLFAGFAAVNWAWGNPSSEAPNRIENLFPSLRQAIPFGKDGLVGILNRPKEDADDADSLIACDLQALSETQCWDCDFPIAVLGYHSDSQQIAVASKYKNKWRLGWGSDPVRLSWQEASGKGAVVNLTWLDAETLAVARLDGALEIWHLQERQRAQLLPHGKGVRAVIKGREPHVLFSVSNDRRVYQWDLNTGQEVQTWTGHKDYVQAVALSPDQKRLYSASTDLTIRFWDLEI